jgi:catechol 2,3-dioxygenase-like lactoylglutathione lyase family enzyme
MIKYLSSVIFVRDMAVSRHFYTDLLGQKVDMDFGLNVSFQGGFAIWAADHALEMILGASDPNQTPLGQRNFELYFEAEALEPIWDLLSGAGTAIVHPIREQPWGQRVMRVYDPDGHIVEIGEPMSTVIVRFLAQGMPAEEVAKRTAMPLDYIQQYLHTP